MRPEDRIAFFAIVIGVAWGALTMAGPPAFPDAHQWVWQYSFWMAGTVVLVASSILVYDFFIRPRLLGKKLDPLLAIAIIAALVAFVALSIYTIRGPQTVFAGNHPTQTIQPEITLLSPKNRYTFKWDPTKGMYFDIQREGLSLPAGQTSNPTFILHNSSSTAAADVIVNWQAEVSGLKELSKTGRLSKYNIKFPDDYTFDLVSSGDNPVPNFRYYIASHSEVRIPFVARDAELFMPLGIVGMLDLFVAAKMPDELGAKTEAFPITISVSWNVPDGGQPKKFRAKIRGVNTKPSGVIGPPEIIGYLEFEIEPLK